MYLYCDSDRLDTLPTSFIPCRAGSRGVPGTGNTRHRLDNESEVPKEGASWCRAGRRVRQCVDGIVCQLVDDH
eukprot:1180406-Prorocentrum_minimum.AAC.3